MDELKINKLELEASALFKDVKSALSQSQDGTLQKKANDIPDKLFDDSKKINVVFVGQYSAGKSSIISALTGKNLKIGGGITTDEVTSFEYNGLLVTDTPGVHSQNRPDHDQITYEEIAKADLLVFVVTNEPLGAFMGEHLKKLLFEKQKAGETMIVVNKMMDAERGNVPEQQKIYIEGNLAPIIAPYSAEDFYTSFIDTNAYNEYIESQDEDDLEDSGFVTFKENLNRFIQDKNLMGRCSTSLFEVERTLENALATFKTGDDCVDGSIHLLNQKRRTLEDAKIAISEKASSIVGKKVSEIDGWGDQIANNLKSSDNESTVNALLQEKYNGVIDASENLVGEISNMLTTEVGSLQKKFDGLSNTQFAKDLQHAIQQKVGNIQISQSTHSALQKTGTYAGEIGTWLSKQCTGANAAGQSIFKLGAYSGANAHKIVLDVGHLLGHKFKPWEAVKWTRGLGVAGKALGVAGAGLGLVLQIVNDKQNAEAERSLREARGEIRQCFNDVGNAIEMKYDEATKMWVAENIDPSIAEIDEQICEINNLVQSKNEEYDTYSALLARTREIIKEIQY